MDTFVCFVSHTSGEGSFHEVPAVSRVAAQRRSRLTGRTSDAKVKLMTLQQDATRLVGQADFREFWPIEVRKTLVRAALTDGEIPPYAERLVRNALRDARNIERRMAKDIEVGEAALSQADRRRLAVQR